MKISIDENFIKKISLKKTIFSYLGTWGLY